MPVSPRPIPAWFWLWAKWRIGHDEFKPFGPANRAHRPSLPYGGKGQNPIPEWAWEEYKRRYVRPKPPIPTSGFDGRGVFTAWDVRAALRVKDRAWVAVRPDVISPIEATPFPKLAVWEAEATLGQVAVERFGAHLYIAQAEGPGQLEAALQIGPSIKVEKALVTNVFMATWPAGWICLPEAYANVNPNATPANMIGEAVRRGCPIEDVKPVLGLYDGTSEGGRRKPLREYQVEGIPTGNWSGYLAEGMTEDDWTVS